MSDDIASLSFEDALAELERIVRGLEGGQQKLEDAIASEPALSMSMTGNPACSAMIAVSASQTQGTTSAPG